MKKVITYGTYDLLHIGHVRLLERAKALGDYLIVGVTADDFDKSRGKINVQQSLMERVEAVRATGIADEIIIEEYEGQKIDDIKRYDIDIFTVGSDWIGKFDYLNEYCKVVYLERTQGISSSQIRAKKKPIRIGLIGATGIVSKYKDECDFVNGLEVKGSCTSEDFYNEEYRKGFLEVVDAVYIGSLPENHYGQIRLALLAGKHVLCESPITVSIDECRELFSLANEKDLILMEALKTAYSTAYNRMLLLAKGGKIGSIVSVDATCTSLKEYNLLGAKKIVEKQNSLCAWGPTALLPILQLLGHDYVSKHSVSYYASADRKFDLFTKIDFVYPHAVASIKVGKGVKSEGELIISGTEGYVYVPSPWWKTDYFELRYENSEKNKRYFYQLDGEGIRYELVAFLRSIEKGNSMTYISLNTTESICRIIEECSKGINQEGIVVL